MAALFLCTGKRITYAPEAAQRPPDEPHDAERHGKFIKYFKKFGWIAVFYRGNSDIKMLRFRNRLC